MSESAREGGREGGRRGGREGGRGEGREGREGGREGGRAQMCVSLRVFALAPVCSCFRACESACISL